MKTGWGIAIAALGVLAFSVAAAAEVVIQQGKVYPEIPGDPDFRVDEKNPVKNAKATLIRRDDGVSITIDTRDLEPGAYTVWVRVFNAPELCTGGEIKHSFCSRGDDIAAVGDPCVGDGGLSTCAVYWIGAVIVGPDGEAHFNAELALNDTPGFIILGADVVGTDLEGIVDPFGSEFHFVLRSHGPAIVPEGPVFMFPPEPGPPLPTPEEDKAELLLLGRQLTRVLGACNPFEDPPENPLICFDAQLAIFPPPSQF